MLISGRGRFMDFWKRAETGPICFRDDFDTKVYWPKVKAITKKYGIEYDPNHMIPCDDEMLDRLWQAAIELVVEVGVLCTDTERIIEFSEKEIHEVIDNIPDHFVMGRGNDAIVCKHRGFEDYDDLKQPVFLHGRILGPISEDIYEKVCWSYIQEPLADHIAFQGNLTSVFGMPVTPNSPWEIMAEMKCTSIVKDVCRRACRPGMADGGIRCISLPALLAVNNPGWGMQAGDNRSCLLTPQHKVEFSHLNRALLWHANGFISQGGMCSYPGGLSGSPAHSAVTGTAEFILNKLLFDLTLDGSWSVDAMYFSNTSKYSMWCSNYQNAAVVKNTHTAPLIGGGWQMTAGIGSEEFFWESAASAISAIVLGCGISGGSGCQSGGLDHASGLGLRFSGEVGKAVAKARLTREQANELVVEIMKKYQPYIDNHTAHTLGGDFRECYDLETVQPKKEYLAIYEKVKSELRQMGLPMG
ncbi:monomethylamine:corrinoid methyltransferase [Desulfitobacterium hafniense]|uniref:monomethylamine:corrinoid methyltransferase n=1 Tax=Desulfitobacterium hafniense TaxID=49338 RepID=UPI00036F3204|nr:monomethylamine:corrinoid methyltransferase [Desulfitobacterium hafniense]